MASQRDAPPLPPEFMSQPALIPHPVSAPVSAPTPEAAPVTSTETASDLRKLPVGLTGFEPATP